MLVHFMPGIQFSSHIYLAHPPPESGVPEPCARPQAILTEGAAKATAVEDAFLKATEAARAASSCERRPSARTPLVPSETYTNTRLLFFRGLEDVKDAVDTCHIDEIAGVLYDRCAPSQAFPALGVPFPKALRAPVQGWDHVLELL